jgi:hypothetical protein
MSHKNKTVLLRWARGLGATLLANVLVVVTNPAAMNYATNHWQEFLTVNLLIPTITAVEKFLRYGSEPGEGDAVVTEGDSDPAAA